MPISEKDILLKISQATSRISNLERVLKRSVKISAQAVGVDRCSIWLTDDDKKYAMVKAVYVRGSFDPVHLGARINLNKFPKFKRLFSEGKVIHSPDISRIVANRSEKKFFAKAKIKSSLSVPLKIKSKILGALNLGTLKNYKTFTPSEIRLCQTIANQIAVGIENARLYKKLEHRASLLQEQSIKALRESKEKYRTLLENLPQLIFLKDKKSVYISANKNYCKSLGIKPEEIKGKTDFDFFPKELAKKYRKDDRDIIKTGRTKEIIEDYIEKGERKIVQTVKTPVLGDGGKPIGVLGIFWDITERKKVEQETEAQRRKLETYIESITDGVSVNDVNGIITHANATCLEMYGCKSKEEMIGKPIFKFVAENELPRIRKRFMQAVRTKEKTIKNLEIIARKKDGSEFPVLLSTAFIWDEEGNLADNITIIKDITERKKVEEKLKKSEERYRTLVETSNDMIFTVDSRGNFLFTNKAFEKILGYSDEEIKKINGFELVHPQDLKIVKKQFAQLVEGKSVDSMEYRYKTKNGSYINILNNPSPIRDPQGNIVAAFGIARDITERKRVEESLKQKILELNSFINNIPDMAWLKDAESRFIALNKAFGDVVGMKPETLISQTCEACFGTEVGKKFREDDLKVMKGRKQVNIEEKILDSKGNELWLETIKSPLFDQSGEVVGTVGIARNVTDRKRADEALRESEDKIKNIFASISDSIAVTDLKGNIIECNQATLDLHCLSSIEEILGRSALDFIAPKDHTRAKRNMKKTLEQGFIKDVEYTLLTKDKREFPGELSASVVRGASGKPAAFVAITKDISERKKAEEALRKSKDLTTILQISYKITQILNLDKMLELACQETAKALEIDRCVVLLLDEKENAGIIKAIYIKNQPHPSILGARLLLKDFPILVKLYQQKERFLHAPVIKNAPLSRKEKDYFRKEKVKSFVIVPIDIGKRLLGTFLVGTIEKERVFTESEIAFVQTLANHLAIAVENAKLMELVKEQAENLKTLSQQVIRTQEDERRKIAQELHDEIGQALTAMKINIEMSKQKIPSEFTQVIDRIKENEELIVQTLEKVRNLTTDLRPPMLDDFGLVPTLNWYIQNFSKRTNIKVTFETNHCRGRFPLDLEMVLYRINQEALTNVAKHANATRVSITLEKKNNFALLTVKDDGVGFDIKKIMSERKVKKGFGLFDIKERVKLLSGDFSITSKPKKGTRLQVRIPCPRGR